MGFKPERLAHRYRAAVFWSTCQGKRIPAQVYECICFDQLEGIYHFKHFLQSGLAMPDGSWLPAMPRPTGLSRHAGKWIRIPEDFSLIGFDNITEELPYIELTTVAVSHEEQMETAVELLLGMVEEGAPVGGKGFCEAGTEAGGAPFLQGIDKG